MYIENNEVKRYPIAAVIAWVMTVLWMAVIFMFSHQDSDSSSGLSGQLAAVLVRLTGGQLEGPQLVRFEGLLRVFAHGFVFFVLGLLVSYAFETINIKELPNAALAFIVSALYAASDELHQVYVPGRAGEVKDFLVDCVGIVIAIIVYQVIKTIIDLRAELGVGAQDELRL